MFYLSDCYSTVVSTCAGHIFGHRCPVGCTFPSSVPTCVFCDIQIYQAVKDVSASYDILVDLLESIERFLCRLDIYTKISPTVAMAEIIIKILVELLSTLALATKQIKQKRPSKSNLVDDPVNLNASQ
jgi:hypothetical protein